MTGVVREAYTSGYNMLRSLFVADVTFRVGWGASNIT